MLDSVEITKEQPLAAVSSEQSVTSGLIAGGVVIAGKIVLDTIYTLHSADDAASLGLTAAYDTANNVLVNYHIEEFYRMFGEGATLFVMIVAQATLPAAIVANQAHTMVSYAKGEIRQIAIAFNPAADYVETLTDGFNSDIRAAIAPAQEFGAWAYDGDKPLSILLEGRSFTDTPVGAADLRGLTVGAGISLEADCVSIIIGQDWDFAETLNAIGKKHAAVGTALGILARFKVNENIGEVERGNLSDATRGKFINAGLSSHVKVEAVEPLLKALDTKGYIFPVTYTGISGYRWNGDHVCAPIIVDSQGRMNTHYISLRRTEDDAVRKLKAAFMPKVKTVQPVATDGKLLLGVVKYFNERGNTIFVDMQAEGLISNGRTITNPNSNLLTGDRALEVDYELQPTGTINKIKGTITLKKTL
jgi:hypothetical protein